jgi:hypothetical protein
MQCPYKRIKGAAALRDRRQHRNSVIGEAVIKALKKAAATLRDHVNRNSVVGDREKESK